MTDPLKDIFCPTCKKKGTWTKDNTFRPFCSARCQLIDLGEWASESRKIPGEKADTVQDDDEEDKI